MSIQATLKYYYEYELSFFNKKLYFLWLYYNLCHIDYISIFVKIQFFGYVFSEWSINYSQGFIRRGFPGTIILFLKENFNIKNANIHAIILYFSYLTYLVFSSIYIFDVRQARKILDWESLAIFLFLPSLVLFPLHDIRVIGRKEFFFFLALFINLFLLSKTLLALRFDEVQENSSQDNQDLASAINKYCYDLFIWFNLLSIPAGLSHEAILFLSVPINMVITFNLIGLTFSKKQVVSRTFMIYLPTVLAALSGYIWKGNESMVLGICESWQKYSIWGGVDCRHRLPGALYYLTWSLKDAVKGVWTTNIIREQGLVFAFWIFVFALNAIILIRASSKTIANFVEKLKHKNPEQYNSIFAVDILTSFSFKYAFIPFIFSFLLYVIALDWGRWFFIVSVSYAICILNPSLICLEIVLHCQNKRNLATFFLPIYLSYSKIIDYIYTRVFSRRFSAIYFVFLIYTLFFLKIPHYSPQKEDLYGGLIRGLVHSIKSLN